MSLGSLMRELSLSLLYLFGGTAFCLYVASKLGGVSKPKCIRKDD